MMLDKKAIDTILALDDNNLALVIQRLAMSAGIDPSSIKIGPSELRGIRSALAVATDGDIQRFTELLKNYRAGSKD